MSIFLIKETNYTVKEKSKLFWKCLLALMIVKIITAVIVSVFSALNFDSLIDFLQNKEAITSKFSIELSILLIVLFLPALEEMAFRGWLTRSSILIVTSLTCLLYYLLVLTVSPIIGSWLENKTIERMGVFISCLIGFIFLYLHRTKISNSLNNKRPYLIILSISFFALAHLSNYDINEISFSTLVGMLIITLPLLLIGYILALVRIENGIIWSFALHALNNSFVIIPLLMGK